MTARYSVLPASDGWDVFDARTGLVAGFVKEGFARDAARSLNNGADGLGDLMFWAPPTVPAPVPATAHLANVPVSIPTGAPVDAALAFLFLLCVLAAFVGAWLCVALTYAAVILMVPIVTGILYRYIHTKGN